MLEQTLGELQQAQNIRTSYISGVNFTNKLVQYSAVDGLAIFEGDIVLGAVEEMEQLKSQIESGEPKNTSASRGVVIAGTRTRWPDGIIPFTIDPLLPNQQRVTDAIRHWQDNTNIRFQARNRESSFVTFRPGSNCSASVGMIGGQQFITLGNGCTTASTIHEIGHCVGLWHEQSREDRNRFVTINFSNVVSTEQHNFNQHISDGDDLGLYDYGSIMHYSSTAFAINSAIPTVIAPQSIGQRSGLSPLDIRTVNAIYPRKVTLGDTSTNGPVLSRRGDTLLLSWTGTGNRQLNFMNSTDGRIFSNKVTLGDTSTATPALTVFQNRYVVAWIGVGNNQLNVMQSNDGLTWTNKVTLGDTSLSSPALAVFGGWLYLAWRGVGNNQLNLLRSFDGIHWSDKLTLNDTTTSGPTLTVFNNHLLLGWRGVDNNQLNVMRTYNGSVFYGKVTLSDTTEAKPYLYAQEDKLYYAWQGIGNQRINLLISHDGLDWSGKLTSGETCTDGPMLATVSGRLVCGWTGTDSAHHLNIGFI